MEKERKRERVAKRREREKVVGEKSGRRMGKNVIGGPLKDSILSQPSNLDLIQRSGIFFLATRFL